MRGKKNVQAWGTFSKRKKNTISGNLLKLRKKNWLLNWGRKNGKKM